MQRRLTMERFEATIPVKEYLAKYADFGRTLDACRKCGNYGTKWSCPPFDFDPVKDVWEKYTEVTILLYKMPLGEDRDLITPDELTELFFENKKLLEQDLAKMAEAYPGSMIIGAGSCDICSRCARQDGLPCRFRGKMRHSIESLGGLVPETALGLFGIEVLWMENGRHPEYYILMEGLLH